MSRDERLRMLLAEIATGKPMHVRKRLDWERRSLRINGFELGQFIKNDRHWDFLGALAMLKPKRPAWAARDDGVLDASQPIGGAKCGNIRRELGRALPKGVPKLFVQAVHGAGYRLVHDVRVPRGEVGLEYYNNLEERNAAAPEDDPDEAS